MYKNMRERPYSQGTNRSPSFSSTLLDQIYRSFDSGGDSQNALEDSGFYSSYPIQKQLKIGKERAKTEETDRWVSETSLDRKTQRFTSEFDHLHRHFLFSHPDADQDSMFFSSGSSSSDSSSSWVSSSDTEFMYGNGSSAKPFCVDPPRPRPVRTGGSGRIEKTEKRKQGTLFHGNRDISDSDGYGALREEENLIKSKSRAMKIYNNLKKVKQPISPGGRLGSFINSLLTATNVKKSPAVRRCSDDGFTGKSSDSIKSGQVSTCSSASSYSRSCLSKHSPSTRDKLGKNGQKRSVTFNYPESVVVGGEDSRPFGHKSLVNYENGSGEVSVSVANAWQIGKSAARKSHNKEEEVRVAVTEKSRRVEEMAREILREFEKKKMKEYGLMRDFPSRRHNDDDEDGDDVISCSSSELFELDLVGNGRFGDELPVYETTHLGTNRAIASDLSLVV